MKKVLVSFFIFLYLFSLNTASVFSYYQKPNIDASRVFNAIEDGLDVPYGSPPSDPNNLEVTRLEPYKEDEIVNGFLVKPILDANGNGHARMEETSLYERQRLPEEVAEDQQERRDGDHVYTYEKEIQRKFEPKEKDFEFGAQDCSKPLTTESPIKGRTAGYLGQEIYVSEHLRNIFTLPEWKRIQPVKPFQECSQFDVTGTDGAKDQRLTGGSPVGAGRLIEKVGSVFQQIINFFAARLGSGQTTTAKAASPKIKLSQVGEKQFDPIVRFPTGELSRYTYRDNGLMRNLFAPYMMESPNTNDVKMFNNEPVHGVGKGDFKITGPLPPCTEPGEPPEPVAPPDGGVEAANAAVRLIANRLIQTGSSEDRLGQVVTYDHPSCGDKWTTTVTNSALDFWGIGGVKTGYNWIQNSLCLPDEIC